MLRETDPAARPALAEVEANNITSENESEEGQEEDIEVASYYRTRLMEGEGE